MVITFPFSEYSFTDRDFGILTGVRKPNFLFFMHLFRHFCENAKIMIEIYKAFVYNGTITVQNRIG